MTKVPTDASISSPKTAQRHEMMGIVVDIELQVAAGYF